MRRVRIHLGVGRRTGLRVGFALGVTALMWNAGIARATESVAPASNATTSNTGEVVYRKWCAPCHDPGKEHPGTHALMAKYGGQKPGALIQRTDLDATYVKFVVRHGVSVMPPFRKTEVTDAELNALATWLVQQRQATSP